MKYNNFYKGWESVNLMVGRRDLEEKKILSALVKLTDENPDSYFSAGCVGLEAELDIGREIIKHTLEIFVEEDLAKKINYVFPNSKPKIGYRANGNFK